MAVTVREYETADRDSPLQLETLDRATRARVQERVERFDTGNLGDHNPTQDTMNRLLKPFRLRLSLARIEEPRGRRAA